MSFWKNAGSAAIFLWQTCRRPFWRATEDMNLSPEQEYLNANMILDGHVMEKNLRHAGKDRNWLDKKLKGYGVGGPEEVLLATHQAPDDLQVYPQNAGEDPSDILD